MNVILDAANNECRESPCFQDSRLVCEQTITDISRKGIQGSRCFVLQTRWMRLLTRDWDIFISAGRFRPFRAFVLVANAPQQTVSSPPSPSP